MNIHRLLIHGASITASAALLIGEFSEEAQENSNKDIRKYRLHYIRKCSSIKTD